MYISEEKQRYDVGIVILDKESIYDLPVRNIASGRYAIFEVEPTEECVSDFWSKLLI
ncbi:MAG: hypothetical protein PHE02_08620 [Lachnospiraceae bacterium]|nr:hypothetical protein [Lachnospiraceae bacterium]